MSTFYPEHTHNNAEKVLHSNTTHVLLNYADVTTVLETTSPRAHKLTSNIRPTQQAGSRETGGCSSKTMPLPHRVQQSKVHALQPTEYRCYWTTVYVADSRLLYTSDFEGNRTFRPFTGRFATWTLRPLTGRFASDCGHFAPSAFLRVFSFFFIWTICGPPDISETTTARKLNLKIPLGMVKYPL